MKDVDDMTEAELAEYYYEHREELMRDAEDITDQVEFANPLVIQMAVRFSKDEAAAIRQAAADADLSVSEFIRNACRAAMDVPMPRDGLAERVERLERMVAERE